MHRKKMTHHLTLLVIFLSLVFSLEKPLTRIAFGSCNRQDLPQPAWERIIQKNPELWIWLGDVIYPDDIIIPLILDRKATPEIVEEAYKLQKSNKEYQKLLNHCTVIGNWDDHDYGENDGGIYLSFKDISRSLFLNFIGSDPALRGDGKEGIYTTYVYGPPGQEVRIILLDTRYFSNPPSDILGDRQWQWLNDTLAQSNSQIHIITSGIQVLPTDSPLLETWGIFNSALDQLADLIQFHQTPGVILLSGDVHHASFFEDKCILKQKSRNGKIGYSLYEVTSSGLTHSINTQFPTLGPFLFDFLASSKSRFFSQNFGVIDIDWDSKILKVTIYPIVEEDEPIMSLSLSLDDLKFKTGEAVSSCYVEHGFLNWRRTPKVFAKYLAIFIILSLTGLCCFILFRCRPCTTKSKRE